MVALGLLLLFYLFVFCLYWYVCCGGNSVAFHDFWIFSLFIKMFSSFFYIFLRPFSSVFIPNASLDHIEQYYHNKKRKREENKSESGFCGSGGRGVEFEMRGRPALWGGGPGGRVGGRAAEWASEGFPECRSLLYLAVLYV